MNTPEYFQTGRAPAIVKTVRTETRKNRKMFSHNHSSYIFVLIKHDDICTHRTGVRGDQNIEYFIRFSMLEVSKITKSWKAQEKVKAQARCFFFVYRYFLNTKIFKFNRKVSVP